MVHLDYRDARPIYAQIMDGLRQQITAGVLQPGDKLPSVRELATALAINPNTIQRAYDALEQEGYAQGVAGKGSFAALPDQVSQARQQALLEQLDGIVAELLDLGLRPRDIARRCLAGTEEEEQHD